MVGILALQGDFREHEEMLRKMNIPTLQVRLPKDLEQVDRLIIPGGESTTIGKLMVMYGLDKAIKERVKKGMPVWGTCAGAILMAKEIAEGRKEGQVALDVMDITVHRNAFGRQIDSFEVDLDIAELGKKPLHVFFIRAPIIDKPGKKVKVLAKLDDGKIVAVQEGKMLATSFHPELTGDTRFHKYFLQL